MRRFHFLSDESVVELGKYHLKIPNEVTMKFFINSAFIDLIEYCKVMIVE